MRLPLVAGNWKMNKRIAEGRALARAVAEGVARLGGARGRAEVVLGPPYLALPAVAEAAAGSGLGVAGQDCSPEKDGAFTGEVSAAMLKDAGATHVILGHSERRELLGEADALVARKASAALAGGLLPILCLGEALPLRQAGKTLDHVGRQIRESILAAFPSPPEGLIVAYEPIWAIGTGVTATPAQAQEVHAFIRSRLGEIYGVDWAAKTRILYGGSVKPENAAELVAEAEIDGVLVGGASLDPASWLAIVRAGGD